MHSPLGGFFQFVGDFYCELRLFCVFVFCVWGFPMEKKKKRKQDTKGFSIVSVFLMLGSVVFGLIFVLTFSTRTRSQHHDIHSLIDQCNFDTSQEADFQQHQPYCTDGIFTGNRSSAFLPFSDGVHILDAITNKINNIVYLMVNRLKFTNSMGRQKVHCLFEGRRENIVTDAELYVMDRKTVIWACSIPTFFERDKILYFVRVLYRHHCSPRLPACFRSNSSLSSSPTKPRKSNTSSNIDNPQDYPVTVLPSKISSPINIAPTIHTSFRPPTPPTPPPPTNVTRKILERPLFSPPSPPPPSFPFAACTKVRGPDAMSRIPDWVAYHHLMGVSQFLIFVNEDPSGWEHLLQNYIKQKIVILVNYDLNLEGRHRGHVYINMIVENACLRHYDGVAKWVMISDVDEYMQPMAQSSTILEVVESREEMVSGSSQQQSVAGFAVWCWFFAGERHLMANYSPKVLQNKSAIELFHYRQGFPIPRRRQKLIVKPEYVTLFSQHIVERVNDQQQAIFALHPQLDMRMDHFRRPIRPTGISSVIAEGAMEVLEAWQSNYPVNLDKFSNDFSGLKKREYCPDRCEIPDESMKKYLLQVKKQTEKYQTSLFLNHSLSLLPPQE